MKAPQGGLFTLDRGRLDYEMGRRGLRPRDLAEAAGVTPELISRARHGRPVRTRTLLQLAQALAEAPLLAGADLVVLPSPEREEREPDAAAR